MQIKTIPIVLIVLLLSACTTMPSNDTDPALSSRETSLYPGTINKTPPPYPTYESTTGEGNITGSVQDSSITGHTDIWSRIRSNLVLQREISRDSVKSRLEWYARNQDYLDRVTDRASPYIYYIVEQLKQRQMPLDLALLPIVESAYHPFAYSRSHASGIWQFIPSTGRIYGLKQNWWYDGRRDIITATDAALNYLQKLHQEFNGDWLLALAAYNAGERNVSRAIEKNINKGKPIDFWSLQLPRETRGYVPSLLAVSEIVARPASYRITLRPIPNTRYFEIIDVDSQIDLATISDLSGLSMDEVYTLNPGINHWATDPKGPHHILLPVDKAEVFKQKLSALPEEQRIKWQKHDIQQGDTLGMIAARYRTDITTIKQVNKLRSNLIRAGHTLLIPASKLSPDQYTLSQNTRRFRGLKQTSDGQQYIYTVKRGDTLWDIGRNYGISVREICAWNGISPGKTLQPGNKLKLQIDNGQGSQNGNLKVATHSVKQETQGHIRYTVQEGDSLWLISRRYGVSIQQIQKWNSMQKRSFIKPGQNLDIYIGTPPADA